MRSALCAAPSTPHPLLPLALDPPHLVASTPPPLKPQINAEKSPYLTEKLKIWMLPTLALIKNEKVGGAGEWGAWGGGVGRGVPE